MKLERVDVAAGTGAVRECFEIERLSAPVDAPGYPPMSFRVFTGWLTYGWVGEATRTWLLRDDGGTVAGWYLLSLPERENRNGAYVWPNVPPARRRTGLGTALLRHAAEQAREAGRTVLATETRGGSAGERFAQAAGARRGLDQVLRVLRLRAVDRSRLAKLREQAQAAAGGYELISWDGATPDDLPEQVAAVASAMADAPRDENLEATRWDAARIRLRDERAAAQGLRSYTVAARHQMTGALAGLTEMRVVPEVPEWGSQDLTVVARPHRGHRLGLLLKLAMLDLLAEREPQLTSILTGNTDGNQHMIAINIDLGFEPFGSWSQWYLDVADALAWH